MNNDFYEELDIYSYLVKVEVNGKTRITKACYNEIDAKENYNFIKDFYYKINTEDHIRIILFDINKNIEIEYVDNKVDLC